MGFYSQLIYFNFMALNFPFKKASSELLASQEKQDPDYEFSKAIKLFKDQ